MKTRGFAVRTILTGIFLSACQFVHAEKVPGTMSREEMAAKVRASRNQQPSSSEPADGETRVIQAAPDGILDSSQILAAYGQWTLVPKGAVVHIPKALADRVTTAPSGNMLPWQDFLVANRSWLGNLEITVDQAAGKIPLKPEVVKSWTIQNKVIVATYQGGAISCKSVTAERP